MARVPLSRRPPPREGLPREERVRKRTDFVRLQGRNGGRVRTRSFLILLDRRTEPGPTRFGLVASKKVGDAVSRNRAKRLLREALRRRKAWFAGGLDVIAIAFEVLPTLGLGEVLADLDAAAREIERRVRALRARPVEPLSGA